MRKHETMNQYNHVCFSTEEYTEFVEYVRQQGGYVTHTIALKEDGHGLSVQYMLPGREVE